MACSGRRFALPLMSSVRRSVQADFERVTRHPDVGHSGADMWGSNQANFRERRNFVPFCVPCSGFRWRACTTDDDRAEGRAQLLSRQSLGELDACAFRV